MTEDNHERQLAFFEEVGYETGRVEGRKQRQEEILELVGKRIENLDKKTEEADAFTAQLLGGFKMYLEKLESDIEND